MEKKKAERMEYGSLVEIARKAGTSPQYVRNIKKKMKYRSRFVGEKAKKIAKLINKEMAKH